MMRRNAKVTVLTVATLFAAGCARSDFALSGRDRSFWDKARHRKDARAVQAPPPKILPETYFAAARLHETQGQFSQAIVQYRKAIAVNHQYVEAYHRLGMLLGATGQFVEANKALHRAVQLSPDDATLRNNLGFQLLMEENWHGARREFRRAIELRPGFARAHVNLGLVLSKLGHFDEAFEQFQAILPEADAYYNLGLMYVSQKRYEDAARAYRATLVLNPDFHAARTQLDQLAVHLKPVTPVEPAEAAPVVSTQAAPEEIEPEPSAEVADVATGSESSISRASATAERSAGIGSEDSTISTATNASDEEFGALFFDTATLESADENANAPCEPTSQFAHEGLDESPFFEVDAVDDASPTPFEQTVRLTPIANVKDSRISEIAAGDSTADDVPVETVRSTQVEPPVVSVSGTLDLTSPDTMDVYDVVSPLPQWVDVGPPAPGELLVCTAADSNTSRQGELDAPFCTEDACWLEQSFEETEQPCDDRFVGELWTNLNERAQIDSVLHSTGPLPDGRSTESWRRIAHGDSEADPMDNRRVSDGVVVPFWYDIVDVRPTIPLAEESVEPGHHVTVKPVPDRSEPAEVVAAGPVKVIAPTRKKVVRVAAIVPTEEPIECFVDELPLPVSWNDVVPEENYCVDRGALFRELDVRLEVVRAEIKCLDEALMDEVYRLAVLDRVKSDQQSPDVSVIDPQEMFVDSPALGMVSSEPAEPFGPAEPISEPILVREEWEESIAEPIKNEQAARLMPVPAMPGPSFDGDAAVFDELVGLCSIVENETKCLAELNGADGPIMSLAFDPTVESKLPPYVSFDRLLDFIWNAPVKDVDDSVCPADPPWCEVENDHRQAASTRIGKSDSDRRASVARRTNSGQR